MFFLKYWRGFNRSLPSTKLNPLSGCGRSICGIGDMGTGLGLRGAEKDSIDYSFVLRRSRSATILRCAGNFIIHKLHQSKPLSESVPFAGRALRCRCFDRSYAGRLVLWAAVGAPLESCWEDNHRDTATLLKNNSGQRYGTGDVVPDAMDDDDHPAKRQSGGCCCHVLSVVICPLRVIAIVSFTLVQLVFELFLAPLEAWQTFSSAVPLAESNYDSDSDNDDDEDAPSVLRKHGASRMASNQGAARRKLPRNCATSCMQFISCGGIRVNPRRWCRWRCSELGGFQEPELLRHPVHPTQQPLFSKWPETDETLEASGVSSHVDPLVTLFDILDTAGEELMIDFARIRLLRHVHEGEKVAVSLGLLYNGWQVSRTPLIALQKEPLLVAVKVAWYFFGIDLALEGKVVGCNCNCFCISSPFKSRDTIHSHVTRL